MFLDSKQLNMVKGLQPNKASTELIQQVFPGPYGHCEDIDSLAHMLLIAAAIFSCCICLLEKK